MDVYLGEWERNVDRILQKASEVASQGADLVVFPEAAITGYCVNTPEDARAISIEPDSVHLDRIRGASRELGIAIVVGYAQVESERVYNCATYVGPNGQEHTYRKTHLPILGLDRFVTPGDCLQVIETQFGTIGFLICYDLRLPEPTRCLALQGAELVVLPTNWPVGAEQSADAIALVRAMENRVFLATCNRIGHEAGFDFIGRSKIVDPKGTVLASAGDKEEVLIADLDLSFSRQKRVVTRPGTHEVELFESRRPALYNALFETGGSSANRP